LIWAFLLGLLAFRFYQPITEAINRLLKFNVPGIASADLAPQQIEGSSDSALADAATRSLPPQPPTTTNSELTPGSIQASRATALSGSLFAMPIPTDNFAKLARFWIVAWLFERHYRIIFGQQLQLLILANSQPVTIQHVTQFYQQSKQLGNPQTYEQFIDFLVKSSLLQSADNGQTFTIQPLGRQFLLYIYAEGYPLARLY